MIIPPCSEFAVVSPADSEILPASNFEPLNTLMSIFPPLPCVAAPVVKAISPLLPELAVPLVNDNSPLTPFVPALVV